MSIPTKKKWFTNYEHDWLSRSFLKNCLQNEFKKKRSLKISQGHVPICFILVKIEKKKSYQILDFQMNLLYTIHFKI